MTNRIRKAASLMLAFSTVAFLVSSSVIQPSYAQDSFDYGHYSNEGSRLFNAGQLSQAIEMFEKALPLAPEASVPIIYNNIAATYIKRSNYFNSNKRYNSKRYYNKSKPKRKMQQKKMKVIV